jgi:alkylation response protein AidB-like acyl-CoA dehydrogenase
MLRDAVRQFAREQLAPNAAAWDRDGTFPAAALKGLAAMGLYGIAIAEEWGGAGMDYTALALAIEEIAAGDGATSTIIQVNNLAAGILSGYGTPAQKERYLKPLTKGDMLGAFALTEPHAGSDAKSARVPSVRAKTTCSME